jgi:ribulose-5-phosphate 4-epimerase/fuculose-1-phosphate aldolase
MEIGNRDATYPEAEWEARVALAAAYRLTDLFGMTTLVYNHITARVPGTTDQFLINEFDMGYDEITASNLVKIDINGRVLEGGHTINLPGYVIHSAVHAARHDVNCVMHTHTPYGMAVSALETGFRPLQQDTYGFHNDISYHEFEGLAVDVEERERLVTDLGNTNNMVLRNHGLLTLGQNVSDAWGRMWNLERACQVQVLAMSTGQPLNQAPIEAIEKTAALVGRNSAGMAWPYLLRKLDAKDPSYKN